jgi:hypothetical protein
MQLIQARLHGSPRTVTTKFGQKVVADAIDGKGNKQTHYLATRGGFEASH